LTDKTDASKARLQLFGGQSSVKKQFPLAPVDTFSCKKITFDISVVFLNELEVLWQTHSFERRDFRWPAVILISVLASLTMTRD
jgi:hypothetical protein